MKPKPRKCKGCGKHYTPHPAQNSLNNWCSPPCGHKIAMAGIAKERKKRGVAQRRDDRIKKIALKTRGECAKEAQTAFNRYIRVRDHGKPCISCGADNPAHAGHYRSIGGHAQLRFNLLNCHAQCVRCNMHLSGNLIEYRKGLIERIGVNNVESLENHNAVRKFDIECFKLVKRIFTKKTKMLTARRPQEY